MRRSSDLSAAWRPNPDPPTIEPVASYQSIRSLAALLLRLLLRLLLCCDLAPPAAAPLAGC